MGESGKITFTMPARRLDYLLMGIVAGIIAGLILVYIFGITYAEILRVGESIRFAFRAY